MEFLNEIEVKIWILKNQIGRRNLNDFQKIQIALQMKPLLEEQAKENQGTRTDLLLNLAKSSPENIPQNIEKPQMTFTEPEPTKPIAPIHVRKEIAKMADVAPEQVRKVEKILKEAKPEDIEAIDKNEKSINAVFQTLPSEIEKQKQREEIEKEEKI